MIRIFRKWQQDYYVIGTDKYGDYIYLTHPVKEWEYMMRATRVIPRHFAQFSYIKAPFYLWSDNVRKPTVNEFVFFNMFVKPKLQQIYQYVINRTV